METNKMSLGGVLSNAQSQLSELRRQLRLVMVIDEEKTPGFDPIYTANKVFNPLMGFRILKINKKN